MRVHTHTHNSTTASKQRKYSQLKKKIKTDIFGVEQKGRVGFNSLFVLELQKLPWSFGKRLGILINTSKPEAIQNL